MDTFLRDLAHSLRMFRQNPTFTAAAIAALAVGIGANTAIFSVVNTVLLKPPPFPRAERIVLMMQNGPDGSGTGGSPAKFAHWSTNTSVLEDVAAYRTGNVNWTSGDVPVQLRSATVSRDFFKTFGAPLVMGRSFAREEDLPKGPRTVLISENLWESKFSRDGSITSKTMLLGGEPYSIIGVVGKSFDFRDFGRNPDVFTAFQLDPNTTDQGHYFNVAARLKEGVSIEQAASQVKLASEEFRRRFPDSLRKDQYFGVQSLQDALVRDVRTTLLVLAGAVGMVLLIACANVANLLLARAVGRRREFAIRSAIGAGRGRLIRQLLTESLLLAVAGGVLGGALGFAGMRALLGVNTANLPRVGENGAMVSLDWRVLLFAAVVSLLTSVLFGLIPALQSFRVDLNASLRESANRAGTGLKQNRTRTLLVASELALAVVLLCGAALLIRTSLALAAVKPGFDATNVLTMRMSLAGKRFEKSAAVEQLVRDGVERLKALPGVESASATCCVPLEGGYGLPFKIEGRALTDGPFHGGGSWRTVSPGYFEVFKIPMVRGRTFEERDNAAGLPVVIINQAMAKEFWKDGADPMNARILIGKGVMSELESEQPRQIIGIVSDVRDGALNQNPQPGMYIPNAQTPDALNVLNLRISPLVWVVRTKSSTAGLSGQIQEQIRQASGLPISDVRNMEEVISRSTSRERFNMLLMTVFGGAALVLAAIGVYGLMAYSVQQRSQEIGIRMALGAQRGDVREMVVKEGMRFALLGVALGTAGALALARYMSAFLYGVEARDPLVFVAIPLVLAFTALVAVWIPAQRATHVDPVLALRGD